MAIITHIEREVATFIEREPIGVVVISPFREVCLILDAQNITVSSSLKDTMLIINRVSGEAKKSIRELAFILDNYTAKTYAYTTVKDTAIIKSKAYPVNYITTVERDVALISSSLNYISTYTTRETAYIKSVITSNANRSEIVRDSAKISSAVKVVQSGTYREVASFIERPIVSKLISRLISRESVLISSNYFINSSTIRIIVRDVFTIKSSAVFRNSTEYTVKDIVYISSKVTLPYFENEVMAYTCSTDTWGMSQYTNFPFSSMTSKFATDGSLWDLTGNTDNDKPVHSHILTGQMDFGVSEFKHIDHVYFNGTTDFPLKLQVFSDNIDGNKIQPTYPLPARSQTNIRNNRATLGKGLFSRYYQFKIISDGLQYKLLDIEASITQNPRRI